MRMRRISAAIAAGAAAVIALAPASPAFAIDPVIIEHDDTNGVVSEGGATATVETKGLRFVTLGTDPPESRSNFYHYFIDPGLLEDIAEALEETGDVPPELLMQIEELVPFALIEDLSYWTQKLDDGANSILPAYKLEMVCPVFDDEELVDIVYTTLVYEPAEQGTPLPDIHDGQTWDVLEGLFWSTYQIGGDFGTDLGEKSVSRPARSLFYIFTETVCGAGLLLSVQVGQGASTTGADALADELFFHGYAIPVVLDEEPGPEIRSAIESAKATVDFPGEFAFEHIWKLPPAGPGEMPETGSNLTSLLIAGGALLVLGAAAVVLASTRRRTS